MADDIRSMTAQLAAEPDSMVFLELAEALRARGQLDAAYKVIRTGLGRYPQAARARDLCARILCDRGEPDRAFEEWVTALRLDPALVSAHKGLGFLYCQAGDFAAAEQHLAYAAQAEPGDAGARAALDRVRAGAMSEAAPHASAPPAAVPAQPPLADALPPAPKEEASPHSAEDAIFAGLDGGADGLLLVNASGLRLGGGLRNPAGADVADAVAAQLAGVAREAERTARLLGLDAWRSLAAECADGNLLLTEPSPGALLLSAHSAGVPMGRVAHLAARAGAAARAWLERGA
ncbi:MAG TPA: roadblock/LC7 domain-containing protein [Gemmatimonadales bacterium]|nr:roadblock/LC7 domain-containing protein [Gemmatimonadales bacterium]